MTGLGRRDFLTAAAGALALGGCSSLGIAAKKPEPSFVWSYLVHFGYNSWIDAPIEKQDKTKIKPYDFSCVELSHNLQSRSRWGIFFSLATTAFGESFPRCMHHLLMVQYLL